MKIKEIISDSISFPFSNPARFFTLGIILVLSLLILPIILARGYLLRIIKNTSQNQREMPPFEDWTDMFIDGLKFFVVNLAYSIPGAIFIYGALMISLFTSLSKRISDGHISNQSMMYSGSTHSINYLQMIDSNILLLLVGIGLVLLIIGYLVQMIALPHMVYKNKFGAAFDIKAIYKEIRVLGWKNYLICGIFFVFVLFVFSMIGMLLPVLLSIYGLGGYVIGLIIMGLLFHPFEYALQGRFLGLIYPGEVENEDSEVSTDTNNRKPRSPQEE